nr:M20/M25/M40 family metallo-hydrolase [Actinomycetota bacterium]
TLEPALGDSLTLVEAAPAAPPGLDHPVLARLAAIAGGEVRAKLGWTDVAFFTERGIPAANFGPGDPELAHRADERVERADLDAVHHVLRSLLTNDQG